MPPKKAPQGPAKKKVVADATFGMKNKKGKKGQEVAKQIQSSGVSKDEIKRQEAKEKAKAEKQLKWEREQEAADLFKKVEEKQKPQIAPVGVNPKTILCIYFKKGHCQAGDACKFAHDFEVEHKAQTKDMYTDTRDVNVDLNGDMKDWDENTLRTMLKRKEVGRPANASNQVCKHFVKAIEESRWGWFWECPNGNDKCVYRHALPPDYVLKKDRVKDKIENRPLELVLEEERASLTGTGTKVTPESFAAWKEKNRLAKEKEMKKAGLERAQQLKQGKVRMTGKELMESGGGTSNQDDGSDDGIDLFKLMKDKQQAEIAIDEENAVLAAELAKEVEAELARQQALGDDADESHPKESNGVITNSHLKNNNNISPRSIKVDENLFRAEEVEDIDFSDDDDEKK
jgi:hypothetical protein